MTYLAMLQSELLYLVASFPISLGTFQKNVYSYMLFGCAKKVYLLWLLQVYFKGFFWAFTTEAKENWSWVFTKRMAACKFRPFVLQPFRMGPSIQKLEKEALISPQMMHQVCMVISNLMPK